MRRWESEELVVPTRKSTRRWVWLGTTLTALALAARAVSKRGGMMESSEMEIGIYVLPTEEGMPPRAVVGPSDGGRIIGPMMFFSGDMGCWTLEGQPIHPGLNEALTERATELGVPGFD